MREMAVGIGKNVIVRRNSVCVICGKNILTNERCFKTGKTKRKNKKGLGIRTFCSNCVNKIYVDGEN
jgi:hypothetical protein